SPRRREASSRRPQARVPFDAFRERLRPWPGARPSSPDPGPFPVAVAVGGLRGVDALVVARERSVVAVVQEPDHLPGLDDAERLFDHPLRRPMRGDEDDEAVDHARENSAVGDADHRGRVDDDVVVIGTCVLHQLREPWRTEELVRRRGSVASGQDVQVERRTTAHGAADRDTAIEKTADEARARRHLKPELFADRWTAKVSINQEHPGSGGLCARAREIDGGGRLAVTDRRAGDSDDRETGAGVKLFDHVSEGSILLGLERRRRDEAHEVPVELFGAYVAGIGTRLPPASNRRRCRCGNRWSESLRLYRSGDRRRRLRLKGPAAALFAQRSV